jgi:hypothetical protein
MALLLMEGFDHLAANLFTTKGWNANPPSVQAGRPPDGNCARMSLVSTNGTIAIQRLLPSSSTTLIAGFGWRTSYNVATATNDIFVLMAAGGQTFRVAIDTSRRLVIRNSTGTVIATGTTALNLNTFYYIEVKAFANGASGTCELHLNGAAEIASTVGNFGSTAFDTVRLAFQTNASNPTTFFNEFDDLYVVDTTGAANNTFLGDFHVYTLFPSADGAHTDYTPSAAGSHFSKVNEQSPDGDTSYVSDATVGHRDSYAFDDLPVLAGAVFGVQTNLYARKDDVAARQIAAVARPGSTDRDGATVTLGTTYAVFSEIRETNPDTSAAWTIGDVNASEFGVKTVA